MLGSEHSSISRDKLSVAVKLIFLKKTFFFTINVITFFVVLNLFDLRDAVLQEHETKA